MDNKYYRVYLGKNKIIIYSKEPSNAGVLKILFSTQCLEVNPKLIEMIYKDITIYLKDRFNVALSLVGENVVTITKNQFILQGSVKLNNAKLTNPILDNVSISHSDLSKSKEIVAIRSVIQECKSKISMPLRFYLVDIYRQSEFERHIRKLTI